MRKKLRNTEINPEGQIPVRSSRKRKWIGESNFKQSQKKISEWKSLKGPTKWYG